MKGFARLLWYLLVMHILVKICRGVKIEMLTNTTYLNPYTDATMYPHLSFDTPLQERGKLVDYDSVNVYMLARQSFADLTTYKFVTVKHADLTSTGFNFQIVYISGYEINGMCQYQGKLDYFIGLHLLTGDLRVCNFITDSDSTLSPLYCKSIPKRLELEPHFVYSDCKYSGTVNGMNTYIIGVGASSFDPAHPGQYNYMYAKFNTLYNITESLIESHDPDVSERLVDVKVDLVHEQVYVVLDINSNEYLGVSIYEAGDELTENNPNVAILAYSFYNAVVNWVKIFGDINGTDYYTGLELDSADPNHIVLVLNSYTSSFTLKEPSKDILAYKIRYESGYVDGTLIMGSSSDDIAHSLVRVHQSIYILATINNNFYPHPNTGSVWGISSEQSFGLIWINSKFSLVDIEGYPVSSLSTFPIRVFPSLVDVYVPQFMFIAPASKYEVNGVYITNFNSAQKLYSTFDCNLTCNYCSRFTKQNDCIYCDTLKNQFLHQGACVTACPAKTRSLSDEITGVAKKHCGNCHFSCKTCLGPRKDQCNTCCQTGDCGSSLLDTTPDTGTCKCPSGSYESHGRCLERCVNGLYARLGERCYEKCPKYSQPEIKYDDPAQANEFTHYEYANDTDCVDYNNLLKFNVVSQGLEIPGPLGLSDFPKEFTISFWARADLLGTETYLLNLFQRVYIKIVNSRVRFLFERSASDMIEPTYSGSLNQITEGKWIYIAFSQKEHKDSGTFQISQKLVIANGRTTEAVEAGSKTDHTPATYHKFVNTIFLGGLNYTDPNSFTGYLKELKIFSQFHDSPQMINDRLRIHLVHSFEDPRMIAYWKLSENYTQTDTVQTIYDYSKHNMDKFLSVSFNPTTNPDYPTFVHNNTLGLKLCFYHDVAICKAVAKTPQIFSKGWRITNPANFQVSSLTHTIATGDVIYFKDADCGIGTTKASMSRSIAGLWIPDSTIPPENLEEGHHYYMCYQTQQEGYLLELGQIYLAKTSTKVDPSDVSSFVIVGLEIQVDVSGGDEAYGDIIRFSEDCDVPKTTDLYIERKTNYIYSKVITKNFQLSRRYKMCVIPTYAKGADFFMDNINNHEWIAAATPQLGTGNMYTFYVNDKPLNLEFVTPFTEGDIVSFAWKRDTDFDCDTANLLSPNYEYKYGHHQMMWLGNSQGIKGLNSTSEVVHVCWKSNSIGGDPSFSRIGLATGHNYRFVAQGYTAANRINLPELSSVHPHYGSTEFFGADAQIQFNFGGVNVFPAKRAGTKGKLAVLRGGIKFDGSISIFTTSKLYEITTLDEAFTPNSLEQGNLKCTALGSCNLTLSDATSTGMKRGEVYYLAIYPNSFASNIASQYYLFGNNTNGGEAIYYHLFYSRSFNIPDTPTSKIYGNTIVIEGVNLLNLKDVLAKESMGALVNGTWGTTSIKVSLRFSGSTCSTSLSPFASVYMKNVNDTHITINNMDLKGCSNGNLVADFEVVRGIKTGLNKYSYLRREYQKDVALGEISCHSSCLKCDGPTDSDCLICANYSVEYLFNGKCYPSCPTTDPYWLREYIIHNAAEFETKQCKLECGKGYFVNNITNECEQCNLDCQTCESDKMLGCITCNPIKYYYNGMCTETCPVPEYLPQNTNYQCVKQNLTSYISVEILKDAYLHKIPRNKQFYLKAFINNKRGTIDSAKWTQLTPTYSRVTDNVFTMEINTLTNEVYNTEFQLKMRMTAFTYISELTSIKYMLEVNNTMGDVGKQITEFYINPAPVVGTMTQEIISGQTKPQEGITTLRIRLANWYDRVDDTSQQLSFKLYMVYNDKTFILKNAGNLETFDFTLPSIDPQTSGSKNVTVRICVDGVDRYLGVSTRCISLQDVNVSTISANLDVLSSHSLTLDFTNDDTMLWFSASAEVSIPKYLRSPVHPHICTVDFQCYNGVCDSQTGSNYCKCHQGYAGQNCQYPINAYHNNKELSKLIFAQTWTRYGTANSISIIEFDVLLASLRGMLKDPEMQPYSKMDELVILYEKLAYMENFKVVALRDYSVQMFFEAAERMLAKIYLERKKIKADPTHIRYPGMNPSDAMAEEAIQRQELAGYARRVHNGIIRFIKEAMYQLGSTNNAYTYIGSTSFEFKVKIGYPPEFEGTKFTIRNSDIYWDIPTGIFSNFQTVASDKHQVYVMAIKWFANPFTINGDLPTQTGTNATTLTLFDGNGNELKIRNLTNSISVVYPYSKSTGYSVEFLKCQYFDEVSNSFKKDGCGHAFVSGVTLPCTTCAIDNSYVTTNVFLCRCTHLTTVGGVYEPNSVSKRDDARVGIYIKSFAMNYWKKSFGYYLVWPALCMYFVGLIVAIIFDCFTLSKMKKKIQERIKLVGRLNLAEERREKERQDLLPEEEKKLNVTLYGNDHANGHANGTKVNGKGLVEEEKGYGSMDEKDTTMEGFNGTKSIDNKSPAGKKKKKIIKPKVFKKKGTTDQQDTDNEGGERSESANNGLHKTNSVSSIAIKLPKEETKGEPGEMDSETGVVKIAVPRNLKKKRKIIRKKVKNGFTDTNHKTVEDSVKALDENDLKTSRSGDNTPGAKKDDNSGSGGSDSKPKEEVKEQKYKMPTTVDVFENGRTYLKMLSYSNTFVNVFMITSYLCPRHIRASMLYTNLILIWFLCAVFYNNTKDPLVVPDFEQSARSLAMSEVWIALAAPLVSMTVSYIFWGVFRVSDKRFHQHDSYEKVMDGSLMKSLVKEMYLRFMMAYFIMTAIFAAVLWYIIEFTAKFGWKISWMWWYSGTFAFLFNYFLFDPLITWFHYVIYDCSRNLWRKVMAFRGLKIACPEVIDELHIPALTEEEKEKFLNEKPEEEKKEENQEDQDDDKISVSDIDSIRHP